ncbi:MAG TPA: hypothetical protein VM733_02075 [Thermoanaerobaculia bacterium]|nr:hypothetical protein [Thermoanaerobaculia bacterium]
MADHWIGECPLSLVDSTPAVTDFDLSPHGVFRSGALVYVLRGNVLTTYTTNDTGNLTIAREDFISSLAARETEGGTAFANGILYVSSEAGLEVFDLTNTRVGGTAPVRRAFLPGLHYRRLAVSGNRLAGLYPATDLPCYPLGSITPQCINQVDILDVTSPSAPGVVGTIRSLSNSTFRGLNDIAFNQGYLMVLSEEGLTAVDISNPAAITRPAFVPFPGKWLVSNGADVIGVGTDSTINIFSVRNLLPIFTRTALLTLPQYLTLDRANAIRFSRNAWWDEGNGRLVTMIEEVNPMNLHAARTIAFDVFDLTVPLFEGEAERIFEDVTMLNEDEVKHNPVVVGPFVYVIGEETGLQSYGSCGQVTGRIELDSPRQLTCNGANLFGWVTGQQKIVSVEVFLNNTPLGPATLGGVLRTNVSSNTPVSPWQIRINLDTTARGEYQLRAIGTDIAGRRRQFASRRVFFEGPGSNCSNVRRRAVR